MKKKKTRDSEATKENIIQKATACFAESGYHGTVLDDILKKAKVNKQLIYYYFGSKEDLYFEIHSRGWKELQSYFHEKLEMPQYIKMIQEGDFKKIASEALRVLQQFIAEHLIFQRLVTWDALEGGKATRHVWKDIRQPLVEYFVAIIKGAQKEGMFPKDLEPQHFLMSILGSITFYFIFENSLQDVLGTNPLAPKSLKKREDEVINLFLKLIQKEK